MNTDSVIEYYLFLNEQVILQEKMLEHHSKAASLLKVLLETNLSRYSYGVLHHYLWSLDDNLRGAKVLNESVLETLQRILARMERSNRRQH